jgi:hypothetical protein
MIPLGSKVSAFLANCRRFVSVAALLLPIGCQSPFVGHATFAGAGDVRTDGERLIALGEVQGEAGIFAKGSNLPLTMPFVVASGEAFIVDESGERTVSLDEPLPAWARGWYPSLHRSFVEALLGRKLVFEAE